MFVALSEKGESHAWVLCSQADTYFGLVFLLGVFKDLMKDSPVFIIDGDLEDKDLLNDAWQELGYPNQLYFFSNAEDVIEQLETRELVPFLIISEVKLPRMSGLELKHYLLRHEKTNFKSIPFVFLTGLPSQLEIEQAYHLCTNGVFQKPETFSKLKQQLIGIVTYWRESLVPLN